MQFDEMGLMTGKTLFLLPGTACDYQTNFGFVLDRPGEKYHLACVNYDGFDGSDLVFPDILTVTEKKKARTREKLKGFFEMDGETADKFMACFEKMPRSPSKMSITPTCSPGWRMTSMWSTPRRTSSMRIRWGRSI